MDTLEDHSTKAATVLLIDQSESVDGFARWLSDEGFFEESGNIYRELYKQNMPRNIRAYLLFGYGMLFMSKAMNQQNEREVIDRARALICDEMAAILEVSIPEGRKIARMWNGALLVYEYYVVENLTC